MSTVNELDIKIKELEESLDAAKKLRHEKASQANDYLLNSLADISCKMLSTVKYGGNIWEYLDEHGIIDFDLYLEGPAIYFLTEFFCRSKRIAANIYAPIDKPIYIKSNEIKSLSQAKKNKKSRVLITFFAWNYSTYKKLSQLNYRLYPFGNIIDYCVYKTVVMHACRDYIKNIGANCLFTRFPQANHIKNASPLEKYLADNSIYSYNEDAVKYGLNPKEVISTPIFKVAGNIGIYKNSDVVYKFTDYNSENINIINGFRHTTDTNFNAEKKIWLFGSSVVLGLFADDENTIASSLQRKLNVYFKNNSNWMVINASNFTQNDVGYVEPFLKSLPIESGDICIFHMEFPMLLLERYDEIIDMSPYFNRPHNYGEVFVDINHMTGKGYCAQGKVLFELLKEKHYLEDNSVSSKLKEEAVKYQSITLENNILHGIKELTESENKDLQQYLHMLLPYRKRIGAIVMNCNPFTLGHRYLIEQAASEVEHLYIFVVEEDKSVFPFDDRIELVKKGTEDLSNVTVLPSGKFIISQRTFAAYSNKSELQDQIIDSSMDVEIFARTIAPALGISIRFAGEEPLDNVTRQYNDTMKRILPKYGVEFKVIPRKESGGIVISASRVRKLLEENNFDEIAKLVSNTTLEYLMKKKN